jgi:hypothetical protein
MESPKYAHQFEIFEKYPILVRVKEGDNFNHPGEICFALHRASRNLLNISRINSGGLKFEPDGEIGQKGAFCKGLNSLAEPGVPVECRTVN